VEEFFLYEVARHLKLFAYLLIIDAEKRILIPENQLRGKVIGVEKLTKLVLCI
jgi:hypothetical protein